MPHSMLWSLLHTLSNLVSSSPESAPWITTVISVCVGRGRVSGVGREIMISGWYIHVKQRFQPARVLLLRSVFVWGVKLLVGYWQKCFTSRMISGKFQLELVSVSFRKHVFAHLHGRWMGDSARQTECVRKDYWCIYACFQNIWRSWL